ncbi:ABC transporter substrate-binding protein [Massilia sp. 9I]|uniref:ABC transporter substrate-binding protein n=1 Tax=Massilia sp. 9I TaxID=2653152 RepID=UPI0012F43591|nr:ABC transporter substrate-binding protein [Massilia sp. 9I]VXB82764.1 Dibenzothiophene desulfurization enzyme B [Massilia sp. 9I]
MTSLPNSPTQLWYSCRGGATATGLAVRKGWLHAEFAGGGTQLRALEEAASRDIRLSYYHHGQTGLVREGGNIPAIWARSENQSAVVVGVTWVDEYQGILVRRDSGIRELADLKGKRLGLPLRRRALIDIGRASAQKAFVTALTLAGRDPRIARWTHIEAPDFEFPQRSGGRDIELAALRSGYVDAVFLRGAQGYAARGEADLRELVDLNRLEDPLLRVNNGTPRPVTVDRAFLARHPDVVRRYLAVLLRAASWARAHPDEVAGLVALENPGYTVDAVAGALGPGLHRSLSPALGPLQLAGLAAQKDFLLDWGYIRHDFDVADWTDPAPLAEALASEQRAPAAALAAGAGALRHGVASHVH